MITLQQIYYQFIISSAATISPSRKNVVALEDYVISCVFDDIPAQMTGVTWAPATETESEYRLLDGSINSSNSQTSTLSITKSKLTALEGQFFGVHMFTCSYAFGRTNFAVSATQTIVIYIPSNTLFQISAIISRLFIANFIDILLIDDRYTIFFHER